MRVLTKKDGEFLTYFNEDNIRHTSLKEMLSDNHIIQANEGTLIGQLALEHIF